MHVYFGTRRRRRFGVVKCFSKIIKSFWWLCSLKTVRLGVGHYKISPSVDTYCPITDDLPAADSWNWTSETIICSSSTEPQLVQTASPRAGSVSMSLPPHTLHTRLDMARTVDRIDTAQKTLGLTGWKWINNRHDTCDKHHTCNIGKVFRSRDVKWFIDASLNHQFGHIFWNINVYYCESIYW